jgi:hypothetical protein
VEFTHQTRTEGPVMCIPHAGSPGVVRPFGGLVGYASLDISLFISLDSIKPGNARYGHTATTRNKDNCFN